MLESDYVVSNIIICEKVIKWYWKKAQAKGKWGCQNLCVCMYYRGFILFFGQNMYLDRKTW